MVFGSFTAAFDDPTGYLKRYPQGLVFDVLISPM